jgi:hypothetical protein
MRTVITWLLCSLATAMPAAAAELHAPKDIAAGTDFSITLDGSSQGTFYLIGPATAKKHAVENAREISVPGTDIEKAGNYQAILCSSECVSTDFYVHAAEPDRLSLLVHPSRVPVATTNAISAVAIALDRFHNMVFSRADVNFSVNSNNGSSASHAQPTNRGIAWIRLTSAAKASSTKISASVGETTETRVVEQVASEACHLHIKSSWQANRLVVETDPVRDCSGNNVPDGTVVSFTKTDASGKTTVDAPIKKGIAKAEMPVVGHARISVASGVVLGNELNVGGAR